MVRYDPPATITDVEIILNVSYGTAVRRMSEMKKALGISKYQHPLRSQVEAYFGKPS